MENAVHLSEVARCTVPECVYNRGGRCYARAITVGNGELPQCDTFFSANNHVARQSRIAGVGACKVYACRHNEGYECTAEHIYVGYAGEGHYIGCLTYARTG